MPTGLRWPMCQHSGNPLLFLCQINTREIQIAGTGPGLLQFFASADGSSVEYEDSENYIFARLLPVPLESGDQDPSPPEVIILEPAMVSTWEKICDYPGRDEEEFDFQQAEQYSDGEDAYETKFSPVRGLKARGWPYWVRLYVG